MSLCDHYTRVQKGGAKLPPDSPVVGLLFGLRNEFNIVIMDATEAIYSVNASRFPELNLLEIEKKIKLWLAVYPNFELVGWYSVGTATETYHAQLHQILSQLNNNLVLLLINCRLLSNLQVLYYCIFSPSFTFMNYFTLERWKCSSATSCIDLSFRTCDDQQYSIFFCIY